jgi:hypothetical protein
MWQSGLTTIRSLATLVRCGISLLGDAEQVSRARRAVACLLSCWRKKERMTFWLSYREKDFKRQRERPIHHPLRVCSVREPSGM